jgi:uncharacterized membrane protein
MAAGSGCSIIHLQLVDERGDAWKSVSRARVAEAVQHA